MRQKTIVFEFLIVLVMFASPVFPRYVTAELPEAAVKIERIAPLHYQEPSPVTVVEEVVYTPKPQFLPVYFTEKCLSQARDGDICIDPQTPHQEALAMLLYNEGAGIHPQLAVDLLQLIDNMLNIAWENHWQGANPDNIFYSNISEEDRFTLLQFWASKPYQIVRNNTVIAEYPGWNGWAVPFPAGALERYPYGAKMYANIVQMVSDWTETGEVSMTYGTRDYIPALILRNNHTIMYVYSGKTEQIPYLEANCKYKYRAVVNDRTAYNVYYSTFPYIP
jgi:hypothetical protein